MIQRSNSDLDVEERSTREANRLRESDLDRIADAYREHPAAAASSIVKKVFGALIK